MNTILDLKFHNNILLFWRPQAFSFSRSKGVSLCFWIKISYLFKRIFILRKEICKEAECLFYSLFTRETSKRIITKEKHSNGKVNNFSENDSSDWFCYKRFNGSKPFLRTTVQTSGLSIIKLNVPVLQLTQTE